jgi:hypothetical protein
MTKKQATTDEPKQELVTVQPQLPATAADLAAYSDFGAAQTLDVERVMPVLQLIQQNSKALIKSHEKFVKGAEAGNIYNRATGMLRTNVVFVPCAREHCYVEWVPIEKGGGKVGTFPIDDKRIAALRQEQGFGKLKTPEGNEILETFYLYGYVLDDQTTDPVPEPAVLAVKSSSITPYKQFFNNVRAFLLRDEKGNLVRNAAGQPINPPLFAHRVRVSALPKSKDGNDFHVFKFEPANGSLKDSMVSGDLLAFGKRIAEDFAAGRTRVEEDDADAPASSEGQSAF